MCPCLRSHDRAVPAHGAGVVRPAQSHSDSASSEARVCDGSGIRGAPQSHAELTATLPGPGWPGTGPAGPLTSRLGRRMVGNKTCMKTVNHFMHFEWWVTSHSRRLSLCPLMPRKQWYWVKLICDTAS